MQIFVKSLTGATYTFEVDSSNTIESVKTQISGRIGTHVEMQRLVWSGRDLENSLTLSHYEIQNHSTLNLVLRLRGNGDMLKNHIKSTHPLGNDENVDLNSPISVTFDKAITAIDPGKFFKVVIEKTGKELKGTTIFDPQVNTATFVPREMLPSNENLKVIVEANAVSNRVTGLYSDYLWEFHTKTLKSIRIFLKMRNSEDNFKKAIILDRVNDCLYSELLSKSSTKLKVNVEKIDSIFFGETDVKIEDNNDVLQIKDGEVLEVLLK